MAAEDRTDIGDWRRRIDELDLELIRVLNERARCAIEIGKIKRRLGLAIYDPVREEEIVRTMLERNCGPLDVESVRRLFERIIDESRRMERVTAEKGLDPGHDPMSAAAPDRPGGLEPPAEEDHGHRNAE